MFRICFLLVSSIHVLGLVEAKRHNAADVVHTLSTTRGHHTSAFNIS